MIIGPVKIILRRVGRVFPLISLADDVISFVTLYMTRIS
jgi:hypothetical protein